MAPTVHGPRRKRTEEKKRRQPPIAYSIPYSSVYLGRGIVPHCVFHFTVQYSTSTSNNVWTTRGRFWQQEPGPRSRGVRHPNPKPCYIAVDPGRARDGRLPLARPAGEMASVIPEPLVRSWDSKSCTYSIQGSGGSMAIGAASGPCCAGILLPVLAVAHSGADGLLPSEMAALLAAICNGERSHGPGTGSGDGVSMERRPVFSSHLVMYNNGISMGTQ
ncbi:hypothetical protein ACQKWADRAFT_142773 [Trichoderma austrokoningii]